MRFGMKNTEDSNFKSHEVFNKQRQPLWKKGGSVQEKLLVQAQKGNLMAMFHLACILDDEKEGDVSKAAEWYTKAAEGGLPFAQCNLGDCYENGRGVPQDYERAIYWYTKSYQQEDGDAAFSLGHLCERGLGCPQDAKKAAAYYREAYEWGDDGESAYRLGLLYRSGKGVPQDEEEAKRWFDRADELGFVPGERL